VKPKRLGLMLLIMAAAITVRGLMVWRFDATIASDSPRYRRPEDLWSPFQVWNGAGPGVLAQALFLLPGKGELVWQVVVSGGMFGASGWLLARLADGWRSWCWFLLVICWSLGSAGAEADKPDNAGES
jgi:hypothetical protein